MSSCKLMLNRTIVLLVAAGFLAIAPVTEAKKNKKREKKAQKAAEIRAQNYVPKGGWEAYFRDEDGRTYPVILPVEQNTDKDWLGLTFTDYRGPKTRLAVMRVENKTAYGDYEVPVGTIEGLLINALYRRADESVPRGGVEVPLGSIEELLMTALYNTHRFELVERKAMEAILGEQDFAASARVSQPTAARIGKLQGAEYLIFATVNEWTPQAKKKGGGLRGLPGPLGRLKANKSTAEVAMSFRIVDATSGQVLFSTLEQSTSKSWGIGLSGFGGGLGGIAGVEKKDPINYAVYSCINKGSYKLAMWLKDRGWRGSVVKVDGDRVVINAGADRGIEAGTVLTCLSKGEELIDPVTGLSLGSDTAAIGSMKVTAVQEKYSIAMVIQGCSGLQTGDFVELESSPAKDSRAAAVTAGQ